MTTPSPTLAQVYRVLDATDRRQLAEVDHLESQVLRRLVAGGDSVEMPMFADLAARRVAVYRGAADRPETRTTALDVPTPPAGIAREVGPRHP